jgi:hypothetical protein
MESVHAIRVASELIWQDLNSHIAFQLRVSCSIDFSHPALAEQSSDFMRAELRADRDRQN